MANRNAGTPMQRLEAKLDGVTSTEDKIKALAVLTVESIVKMGLPELKKVAGLVDFDPAMKLVRQSRVVTATGAQRNPPRSRTSAGSNSGPVGTF